MIEPTSFWQAKHKLIVKYLIDNCCDIVIDHPTLKGDGGVAINKRAADILDLMESVEIAEFERRHEKDTCMGLPF